MKGQMGGFQNQRAWLEAFPSLTTPPLSYFCSRPIFRAGKTPKTAFSALCSTETLATQATRASKSRLVLVLILIA